MSSLICIAQGLCILHLLYIAAVDARTKKIADSSLILLLLIGLGATWRFPITWGERFAGLAAVGAPLLLIDLFRPGAFGGGDIKLSMIAGGMLGGKDGLWALCAGFLTGGIYCAVMILTGRKKRNEQFAFGPCICFGMICIFFVKRLDILTI